MEITSHSPAVNMTRRFALFAPALLAVPALTSLSLPARATPLNTAPKSGFITRRQVRRIRVNIGHRLGQLRIDIQHSDTLRRDLCKAFTIDGIGNLPATRFVESLRFIRAWMPPESLDPAIHACQHWRNYHTALWVALDRMYANPPSPEYDVAAHFARHHDRAFELLTTALETPARTVAGINAKLRIYMENYGYCAEPGTPGWQSAQGDPEYGAIVALAADTERLAA